MNWLGTKCSRERKKNSFCKGPDMNTCLAGSKMVNLGNWSQQRLRKKLESQAGKAKMEGPFVKQGPRSHVGDVGFWPNR